MSTAGMRTAAVACRKMSTDSQEMNSLLQVLSGDEIEEAENSKLRNKRGNDNSERNEKKDADGSGSDEENDSNGSGSDEDKDSDGSGRTNKPTFKAKTPRKRRSEKTPHDATPFQNVSQETVSPKVPKLPVALPVVRAAAGVGTEVPQLAAAPVVQPQAAEVPVASSSSSSAMNVDKEILPPDSYSQTFNEHQRSLVRMLARTKITTGFDQISRMVRRVKAQQNKELDKEYVCIVKTVPDTMNENHVIQIWYCVNPILVPLGFTKACIFYVESRNTNFITEVSKLYSQANSMRQFLLQVQIYQEYRLGMNKRESSTLKTVQQAKLYKEEFEKLISTSSVGSVFQNIILEKTQSIINLNQVNSGMTLDLQTRINSEVRQKTNAVREALKSSNQSSEIMQTLITQVKKEPDDDRDFTSASSGSLTSIDFLVDDLSRALEKI